jgi:hypothetical protein
MKQQKYGFVYIWLDKKHKRYYIGCHWGSINDGYICSSSWMKKAYKLRPQDFKRRILKTDIIQRPDMYIEEQKYLSMIKPEEIKPINENPRYYNLNLKNGNVWHKYDEHIKTVGQKISASKTGKSVPCTPEKAAAISAAKKGKALTDEHKEALRGIKKPAHTDGWKEQNSKKFKKLWADPEFKARQSASRKAAWIKRKQLINKEKEQTQFAD